MKTLSEIQRQLQAGVFQFTRHALKRAIERNIKEQEIREAGVNVTVIEDYPDDKYSPSCLLLGFTEAQRALHLQVSRMESDTTKIITLYEPDENEWIDYKIRRK
jgi:mannose/cellobiose epimerase-like protein (N-acyl-D-glucosamine 2-epimerase family)